ncbi:uncharacterized protein BO96DRAFT_241629 [Aspergillus niger CBS 101883]|uniref:Uncharacterized protein n=2 Tax=Aspergillus TaxID=5052 RepID=A0A370PAA3_ASPPH|nr:uncharacterized protein BO96DRAFT_241629 [Aspergillus niger CBS 101883]PYH58442.1 hypothetical protein BO96DRAFT_241629 [Aspergillus niger CBS 101883]RDH22807.1 hypothetical protein M747DRAFT_173083 [Aspergillus niger ATCC 13496]RDK39121.1 hypothetical protein M752DRAFT_59994 [Aspergillus phoenicis ATCC 13157]
MSPFPSTSIHLLFPASNLELSRPRSRLQFWASPFSPSPAVPIPLFLSSSFSSIRSACLPHRLFPSFSHSFHSFTPSFPHLLYYHSISPFVSFPPFPSFSPPSPASSDSFPHSFHPPLFDTNVSSLFVLLQPGAAVSLRVSARGIPWACPNTKLANLSEHLFLDPSFDCSAGLRRSVPLLLYLPFRQPSTIPHSF